MPPPDDHPQPCEQVARTVLRALPAGCEGVLVARGQYAPNPAVSQRIVVLARAGRHAWTVAEAWMAPDDEASLPAALAPHVDARAGECDAMYATPWARAWTTDARPFELWDGHGRLLWLEDRATHPLGPEAHAPRLRRGRHTLALPPPRAVQGYLSDDWLRREVRLLFDDRRPLRIACHVEIGAALDPTYDALDLLCDASWAHSLATRLARALDVPAELHPDLR